MLTRCEEMTYPYRIIPRGIAVLALIVGVFVFTSSVLAQDNATVEAYLIGPGDVLEVRFWQNPDLNAQVQVAANGTITLDVIGEIQASGKTTNQLSSDIVRLISRLARDISQAIVRVIQYNHNSVFITGQVNQPGKRSFDVIPDLYTLINEAGGVAEFGDLTRVTIIRGGERAGEVEVINVAQAIAEDRVDELPKIGRLDTVEIPRSPGQLPGGSLASTVARKNVIYVMGAVGSPGPIQFEENLDMASVLALAGGPTTEADLSSVKLVKPDGYYSQTLHVDLRQQFAENRPARYLVEREDAIFVPSRGSGIFGITLTNASVIIGVLTSAVILIDRLLADDDNNNNTGL